MVTPLKSTDNLMNKINEEIFKGLIQQTNIDFMEIMYNNKYVD